MKLDGCGNHGFSYTEKYKKSIVTIYDWANSQESQEIEYQKFQAAIDQLGDSKPSETRMIIPFLIKAGVINELNVVRGKSRIRAIRINEELFTDNGKIFVQLLRIILIALKANDATVLRQVQTAYHKIGIVQFRELCKSEEAIYQDLYDYLKIYKHINKDEFFILTSCRAWNQMAKLDEYITQYRTGMITNIEYVSNINCYQYIIATLEDLGVLIKTIDGYELSKSLS